MLSVMLEKVLRAAPEAAGGDAGLSLSVLAEEPVQPLASAGQAVAEASVGLRSALPEWFLAPWPLGLERWQWLGLPALVALALVVSIGLGRLTTAVLRRISIRTASTTDDAIFATLGGPVRLLWFGLLGALGLYALGLPDGAHTGLTRLFHVLMSLGVFWAVSRAINTWLGRYLASDGAVANPGSRALVSLLGRVGQFGVVALALLVILGELGFSVTSVLAGLGIGGIALALGAQKTLENLFGAFALAVDQPFREGDFVKVEDFVGTVESIGLRSTRIRTLDRTVISVPNGKLADLRLETYAARDRFRLHTSLGLTYGTTAAQIRAIRDGVEHLLRTHPKIWPDAVSVRFQAFGSSSLDVEVMCWFLVNDFEEFKVVREEVLLAFMGVVEANGSGFAFPTRTVHLVQPKAATKP